MRSHVLFCSWHLLKYLSPSPLLSLFALVSHHQRQSNRLLACFLRLRLRLGRCLLSSAASDSSYSCPPSAEDSAVLALCVAWRRNSLCFSFWDWLCGACPGHVLGGRGKARVRKPADRQAGGPRSGGYSSCSYLFLGFLFLD